MATLLSRADLLACLEAYGASHLEHFANALGFGIVEAPKYTSLRGEMSVLFKAEGTLSFSSEAQTSAQPHAGFLRVVSHRRFKDEEVVSEEPAWFRAAQPFEDDDPSLKAPTGLQAPQQPALSPWPRFWPFLKLALGAKVERRAPDVPKLVNALATGRLLRRWPKAERKGWASQAQLIIDYDPALAPFWHDFNRVHEKLAELRGLAGLTVLAFPDGDPGGRCWRATPAGWREIGAYRAPDAGRPVLILSDLGGNEAGEHRRLRWRQFGQRLARAACRAVALMPCPPRRWPPELTRWCVPVYWDRAVRLPQRLAHGSAYRTDGNARQEEAGAERLLALLATAVRIEPALLRAARLLFPPAEMDVGSEFAAWNHPSMRRTPLACYFDPEQISGYRSRFRDEPWLTPSLKQRVGEIIQAHHALLSPAIPYEEQIAKAELLNEPLPEAGRVFAERLAKTLDKPQGEMPLLSKQWLQRMGARQHPSLWQNEALSAAWLKARAAEDVSAFTLPSGLTPEKFSWALKPTATIRLHIRQLGQALVFTDAQATGSRIGEIDCSTDYLQIESTAPGKPPEVVFYRRDARFPLADQARLTLRSDREELQLERLIKPEWASAIGRDVFGLYADLDYKGIVQRFRWINPGEFLMGSPESEPERHRDETLHRVTLTQGFWLADSACTQALWLAAVGENPSRFQNDPNHPVENVSWDDVQQFIKRLNADAPDLAARLPSEAEWEYACRAGTTTPFSFGDNITPEQANYEGSHPYANGVEGLYRRKTVLAKSLPPNAWGLYEMHGNVREWCADWYGAYGAEPIVDPSGPEQGAGRVLRGGSWILGGRHMRSADRRRRVQAFRVDDFGFRLALGRTGASTSGK